MMKWLNYLHKWQCKWSCLQIQYQQTLLKLRNVKYLHEWQWHWELNKYSNSDTEKRSEMYDVYKYRWDIHSIYDEAIESDYDNKYSKYDKNDEIEALSNKYIHK